MPVPDQEKEQVLYFVTVMKFENPIPESKELPIAWLPVFLTAEAALNYAGGDGQVGGFEYNHLIQVQ